MTLLETVHRLKGELMDKVTIRLTRDELHAVIRVVDVSLLLTVGNLSKVLQSASYKLEMAKNGWESDAGS